MDSKGPEPPDDPAVARLRRFLEELQGCPFDETVVAACMAKARGRFGISTKALDFLEEAFLHANYHRFRDDKVRLQLRRFILAARFRSSCWQKLSQRLRNLFLVLGVFRGQLAMLGHDGTASPQERQEVRDYARPMQVRGSVCLARLDPADSDRLRIYAALQRAIAALDGFAFLDRPPPGQNRHHHTILIKPGVNWGYFLYPTVSSWQSVYALTRLCFEAAAARDATVTIIVGDESGIECALHEHTTTGNLAYTGIYHGAVLAGLEQAAVLEASQPELFQGAQRLFLQAQELADAKTRDPNFSLPVPWDESTPPEYEAMIALARQAGVRVVAFDEGGPPAELYTTIALPNSRHFPEGLQIPTVVATEVTDIINLCKPPGRHLILGNSGLSGAVKNYIGLLAGAQRAPQLHGFTDRSPFWPTPGGEALREQFTELQQKLQSTPRARKVRSLTQQFIAAHRRTPTEVSALHGKIVEVYLAFREKERFCVTDLRQTLGSHGPDFGEVIDIGAVIAASDAPSLDLVAGALLELAYERHERDTAGRKRGFWRGMLTALRPGRASPEGFLFGWTWLSPGTSPFDLKSHLAANASLLGPVDCDHLELQGLEFTCGEMLALTSVLRRGQPPAAP